MNEYSQFFFEDAQQNQLFFYADTKQFYFYNYKGGESHLKWLFRLAPRIPFVNAKELYFKDYLPVYIVKSKLQTILIELLATLDSKFYKQEFTYTFNGECLCSEFGEVCLEAANKSLTKITYNTTQLRRKL